MADDRIPFVVRRLNGGTHHPGKIHYPSYKTGFNRGYFLGAACALLGWALLEIIVTIIRSVT